MQNFQKPGNVVTLTAPTGGVSSSGTPVLIGSLLVIPMATVAQTLPFEAMVTGVVAITKVGSQAWAEGQPVFWDDTAKNFTTVRAGNTRAGVAVVATGAGAGETVGVVRLNAIGGPKYFVSTEQTGTGGAQNLRAGHRHLRRAVRAREGRRGAGVTALGPAVFLRLEDLPENPRTKTSRPILTIRGVVLSRDRARPDGMGGIVLALRRSS
jgi:predicted RecA/RadA family phage recombinase